MDIKAARKVLNLSQEQFAQKLEVSVRTIGNWEKGTVAVPAAKVEKIKALIDGARECCDYISIGDNSLGADKGNTVNPDLSEALLRAFEEIAAQRRMTEKAQTQIDDLIAILKSKML